MLHGMMREVFIDKIATNQGPDRGEEPASGISGEEPSGQKGQQACEKALG